MKSLLGKLKDKNLKVNSFCVCYESGEGRGGKELYSDIDAIVKTGGYGYVGNNSAKTLLDRVSITLDHLKLADEFWESGIVEENYNPSILLTTHLGFMDRELQRGQIDAAMDIVLPCARDIDVYIGIETGTEPMADLVNFIRATEKRTGIQGYLGINFDPANFSQYGTQAPLDALGYLADSGNQNLLFGVHYKDSTRSDRYASRAEGDWKGGEKRLGNGHVSFNIMNEILDGMQFKGSRNIEREGGDSRRGDIQRAKAYLEAL